MRHARAMPATVKDALELQAAGCDLVGSPLYGRLLRGLASDYARGGITVDLLEGQSDRPVHDALALRLLGAVHRLVLTGQAPTLARFYPSAGGTLRSDPTKAFLDVAAEHRHDLIAALGTQVQTNEVGRAASLIGGFAGIADRFGHPLRLLEVGSSAGLLLRFDAYRYETGRSSFGPPTSRVRFEHDWTGEPPDLSGGIDVAERTGCDVSPIDPATSEGRLRLLSFVWPDQGERFERLAAALEIAARTPVKVERADAGAWVEEHLRQRAPGATTVVFHAIVLQYLGDSSRRSMRAAIESAGAEATAEAPLAWLRMEPAGLVADVRLTAWPGGEERVLAICGYHGQPVQWGRETLGSPAT
jgi:hypothetical protein